MNENPGETPNPLNPNPVVGAEITAQPAAQPEAQPEAPESTQNPMPAEPAAPMDRPMEQAAPLENATPEKKKKTGLIAGIAAAVAVLLIGGIAAALVLIFNQTDPVTAAMNKIMSGNAPANVAIDGNINIEVNDEFSPISSVNIDLKSSSMTSSMINDSKAVVTTDIRGVGEFKIEFDEVYAGNGDLYFKLDGVTSALEDSGILYLLDSSNQTTETEDCAEGEECISETLVTNCTNGEDANCLTVEEDYILDGGQNVTDDDTLEYFASLLSIVEVIDGEWLKIQ